MNKLGKVAYVSGGKAKIVFSDLEVMSPFIKIAKHVTLEIGDSVIVAMYNNEIKDGIVIGVV